MVKIILVDWFGYPLKRRRRMGIRKFHCGLGPILENMDHWDPGISFEIYMIINGIYDYKPTWRDLLLKLPVKNSKSWIRGKKAQYKKIVESKGYITQMLEGDNIGRDIGAYDLGYQKLKEEGFDDDIVFMNSNVRGPLENNWLLKYYELFRKWKDTGLCGISLNSHFEIKSQREYSPHVQSFYLYTSMEVLRDVFPDHLSGYNIKSDKIKLIKGGEVELSKKILDSGYGICCNTFPDFQYKKGEKWILPEGDIRQLPNFSDHSNVL